MLPLIKIGFLPVRVWDILDILIVGYLIYQIYKLLRGSIAFNIFIGLVTLYVIWWLVSVLKMDLLSALLNQFVSVGVIIIVIIFQPEIRRFLLFLGDTTVQRRPNFFGRFMDRNVKIKVQEQEHIQALRTAMVQMSKGKTGALIVLAKDLDFQNISNSGIVLDAKISESLLESIFNKESPLHDGAVVISNHKIHAASCVLPVSDNARLPANVGLRHRAAVGVTEQMKIAAFVVSEETGNISFAFEGKLKQKLSEKELNELLNEHYE